MPSDRRKERGIHQGEESKQLQRGLPLLTDVYAVFRHPVPISGQSGADTSTITPPLWPTHHVATFFPAAEFRRLRTASYPHVGHLNFDAKYFAGSSGNLTGLP